jgi:hypothetical protein
MFSKLLRQSSFKSIVQIAVDERVESWGVAVAQWELGVLVLTEIFLLLQFLIIYGSVSRNPAQFSFLFLLLAGPAWNRLVASKVHHL